MESIDLRMDELFETDAIDDDDMGAMAPMPDLDGDEPMRQDNDNEDEDGEVNEDALKRLKDLKGAAKKRVMRPQPKLDVDRLKLDRGLPAISGMFENTKFKGKGHEAQDLGLMMGKLEHWAHRLFPKMTFDEFVDRLERIGQKTGVKTCLRKIRLGMPLLDDEIVENVEGGEAEERPEEENMEGPPDEDIDAEEAFEEMLRKERENRQREEEEQNGGADGKTAPPSGGMDRQTEAEILAALDSDDDWGEEIPEALPSQQKTSNPENSDELNLRLTETEDPQENMAKGVNSGETEESTGASLESLTRTVEQAKASSSESSSQNTELNLQLTESEEIGCEENPDKSKNRNQSEDSKCDDSNEDNLDLRLTDTEEVSKNDNDSQENECSTNKAKKTNSTSEEQEGNELNLNLSASDSEMTADEP